MKLKQAFSLLVVSAFFSELSSVSVHAKKLSIKRHDHSIKDISNHDKALQPSLQDNFYEETIPPVNETLASSTAVVPSTSSSSLLRRDLKKDSSRHFFFEQCSDTCAMNTGVATTLDDGCCDGGVSYLKVKFNTEDQINDIGTITLDSTHSAPCDTHYGEWGSKATNWGSKGIKAGVFKKKSSGSSTSEHWLIDCNAPCIQTPFEEKACSEASLLSEKVVEHGSEICFAMITTDADGTKKVAFDQRMPTDMHVFLTSDGEISMGTIHTSCSVPLSQSWGVSLTNLCNNNGFGTRKKIHGHEKHIKISDTTGDSTPHLSFIDGISTKYFTAVQKVLHEEDTESYVQDYSIMFEHCGCTCERFNIEYGSVPTTTPSLTPTTDARPSSEPSEGPAPIPSFVPSLNVFGNPTISPSADLSLPPTEALENPSSPPTTEPSLIPSEAPVSNLVPTFSPTEISTSVTTSTPTKSFENPSSPPTTEAPTFSPTEISSLVTTSAPTEALKNPSSPPSTEVPLINPTSNPTFSPTEISSSVTSTTTTSGPITSGEETIAAGGLFPPISMIDIFCNSACAAFVQEHCVFIGTTNACNINTDVVEVSENNQEGVVNSSILTSEAPGAETQAVNDIGEFGKGTKGKKASGKVGKKGEKGSNVGEANKGEKYHKKMDKGMTKSDIKLVKQSKGKGGKGEHYVSNSGNERHLQQIEYHQSQIEYFKKLLAQNV